MPTSQKNNAGQDTKSTRSSERSNSSNSRSNFANMDDNKQREMSGKGGRASGGHSKTRSH